MIAFIIKHWRLFFDILLVAGSIVAFTLFDPFRMFAKLETKGTANMVTRVRDIGQLITAEYYGEVISSWKEFKLSQFPEDTLSGYAGELFVRLKYLVDETGKKDDLRAKVANDEMIMQYDPLIYEQFVAFLGSEHFGLRLNSIFDHKGNKGKGALKKNGEKKVLRLIRSQHITYKDHLRKRFGNENKQVRDGLVKEVFQHYLDSIPPVVGRFHRFHTDLTGQILGKGKNRQKNIVFIGRGSVKAGFDFGKLDETNFLYDEENKTVHFYGMAPVILNADINPWFIPEQKVRGFELVDYSGQVSFEEAKMVKRQCKEKLLDMARRADIIGKASENGKEALSNFFAVLLEEPELNVEMHVNPFDMQYRMITADTVIDLYEARFIDSLYTSKKMEIDSLLSEKRLNLANRKKDRLRHFIHKLKGLPFVDRSHLFSYYSLHAADILKDSFLVDLSDFLRLVELRGVIQKDHEDTLQIGTEITQVHSIWFEENDFREEFNHTLDLLDREKYCPSYVDSMSAFVVKNSVWMHQDYPVNITDTIPENGVDWLQFHYLNCTKDVPFPLQSLRYEMITGDGVSKGLADLELTSEFDSLRQHERALVIRKIKEEAEYRSNTRIIRELHAGITRFIERIQE